MHLIPLDHLHAHPENANRMPEHLLVKLVEHIRVWGDYPPLIARPHPAQEDHYEILDGHHRAEALRRAGHAEARCEIWDVDDERARILLLTLNRLRGEDDPKRRGVILRQLSETMIATDLAARLPEDGAQIRKLIALTRPACSLAEPPDVDEMPQAVTFFLTGVQRRALLGRLRPIARDRSRALVALLELDDPDALSDGEHNRS